jgi:hypothetical protein
MSIRLFLWSFDIFFPVLVYFTKKNLAALIGSAGTFCGSGDRVTRLGEVSPIGRRFTLGIVLKITEVHIANFW